MKRDTIKNHKDFAVAPDDPMARSAMFLVRSKPARFDEARYGLIATKRTFKLAVERNRAKRLLRDWIAHSEALMQPHRDYIFIARRAILDTRRADGRDAMRRALRYLGRQGGPDAKRDA